MATETKPERASACAREQRSDLPKQGLASIGRVHWNLIAPELMQAAARRGEGEFAGDGPVRRRHDAAHRPLAERQVRREGTDRRRRTWTGERSTSPIRPRTTTLLLADVREYLNGRDELFVEDLYCGADPAYRLSVRYVSPNAWHMAFVRNMFIRPEHHRAADVRSELHGAARAGVPGRSRRSTARAPARSSS